MKPKCDVSKCFAACCYNVPHTKFTLFTNKKRIVTPYKRLIEQEACDNESRKLFLPITDEDLKKNKCPFLRDDFKCNIYNQRPWICRVFGTPPKGERSKFLRCGFLEGKEQVNDFDNAGDVEDGLVDLLGMIAKGKVII